MTEAWLNYAIVLFIQLLLFFARVSYEKKPHDIPRILWTAALTGIVAGPIFDLMGIHLDLVTYALGSGVFFLIFNGIVGYGIFIANIFLMQRAGFWQFCTWILVVTAGFEITNLFTHSWTYTFAVPSMEYWVIAFGSPLVFAFIIAAVWHRLFGYRFAFIDAMLKKQP